MKELDLSNETMIQKTEKGITYVQFKKLLEYEDTLAHCYTLKRNDIDFNIIKNNKQQEMKLEDSYQKLCQVFSIQREQIKRPSQVHKDTIQFVKDVQQKCEETDGIITNQKQIATILTFADCTPILLFDPKTKIIGNIHSGWRGTIQKIGQKAANKMIKEYEVEATNLIACIGPCIGSCHFEVEEDVKNQFVKTFSGLLSEEKMIKKRTSKRRKTKILYRYHHY